MILDSLHYEILRTETLRMRHVQVLTNGKDERALKGRMVSFSTGFSLCRDVG